MSSGAFELESDMVEPLLPRVRTLAGWRVGDVSVFFEVAAARGVPDLVLARFDQGELVAPGRAAVVDHSQVATLVALAERADDRLVVASARDLAPHVGLSAGHLGGTVLPGLAEQGWVAQVGRGRWVLARPYVSPVTRLVTVELKRRDQIGALHQAAAHGQGADRAWVVLDAARLHPGEPAGEAARAAYASRGIGLAILDQRRGGMQVLSRPRRGGSTSFSSYMRRVARAVLAERVLGLHLAGAHSGPTWPVFGRTLPTSATARELALC